MSVVDDGQKESELIQQLFTNKVYEVGPSVECSGVQELMRMVYGVEESDSLQVPQEYPVWTPLDAFEAARQLEKALKASKNSDVSD